MWSASRRHARLEHMFAPASLRPAPGASRPPAGHRCRDASIAAEHHGPYTPYGTDERGHHQPQDPPPTGAPDGPSGGSDRSSGTSDGPSGSGRLGGVRDGLAEVAAVLKVLGGRVPDREDAGSVELGDLDGCLASLKRVEGATAAIKARLVGCATAARAHDAAGMSGTDAYLRNRMGLSAREAKRQAELARGLDGMDDATDALADGRLGAEQAAALGRAARRGHLGSPDQVQKQLLGDATRSSPEQLNDKIRRAEQAADNDTLRRDENRAHARRRASCSRRDDGMWQLHALLDPVGGETVATAIRAFTTPDPPQTPIRERRTPEQRTADGLIATAEAAISAGAPVAGGVRPHISIIVRPEPDPTGTTAQDAADRTSERPDHDPVRPADEPGPQPGPRGPTATTSNGATISPDATERLLCDARLTRIVMNASSQILNVGRATRTWTHAQRTAITARDRHCRGPGCDRPPDWCHIHHIRWWSNGGRTDLDNGILLCTRHHRLVHEGGWTLTLNPTTHQATFTPPNGTPTTTQPRGSPDPG